MDQLKKEAAAVWVPAGYQESLLHGALYAHFKGATDEKEMAARLALLKLSNRPDDASYAQAKQMAAAMGDAYHKAYAESDDWVIRQHSKAIGWMNALVTEKGKQIEDAWSRLTKGATLTEEHTKAYRAFVERCWDDFGDTQCSQSTEDLRTHVMYLELTETGVITQTDSHVYFASDDFMAYAVLRVLSAANDRAFQAKCGPRAEILWFLREEAGLTETALAKRVVDGDAFEPLNIKKGTSIDDFIPYGIWQALVIYSRHPNF